jgi:hypothetical protein
MSTTAMDYDTINRNARPYPAYLLREGETALALFAAGFHGWNDVIHFARNGMTAICVDSDADKLWQMSEVYPEGWSFYVDDAWDFAVHRAEHGITYDVVSVDPFSGDAAERAWDTLGLWLSLARRVLTLTVTADADPKVPHVAGWRHHYFPRSEFAAWLVMERA